MAGTQLTSKAKMFVDALLEIGYCNAAISRIANVHPKTVASLRKKYVPIDKIDRPIAGEGWLFRRSVEAWLGAGKHLKPLLYDGIFAPVLQKMVEWVFEQPCFGSTLNTPTRLWHDLLDRKYVQFRIDSILQLLAGCGESCAPNIVWGEVELLVKRGEVVPCWSGREQVLEKLFTVLNDRYRDFVEKCYGLHDGLEWTDEQIGRSVTPNLTRTRAHQIRHSAIEKMGRYFVFEGQHFLQLPLYWSHLEYTRSRLKNELSVVSKENETLRQLILKIHADTDSHLVNQSQLNTELPIYLSDLDIDMNVRLFNCLHKLRPRVETLQELVQVPMPRLREIRCFGKDCERNLINIAARYGFKFTEQDPVEELFGEFLDD